MDLRVTGGGRVTEADGGEQRGGDTLISSLHMFTIPCIIRHLLPIIVNDSYHSKLINQL